MCHWVLLADCDITIATYSLEHLLYEPNNARDYSEESVEEVNEVGTYRGRGCCFKVQVC